MADDPKVPTLDELRLDITDLSYLVDLPPGGMQGLRTEKDDYPKAHKEIVDNQASHGVKAGITAEDVAVIVESTERIEQIDDRMQLALKMVEVLRETRAKEVDRREKKVSTVSKKILLHAKDSGSDEVLAKYDNTLDYYSQLAKKAAKSRRENAEEESTEEEK